MRYEGYTRLAPGATIHGFVVERAEELPEVEGVAWIMHHEASGTPLMWLATDDENMSFSAAFKTPPADDTGVFHILEHSVLCGSERYPVKEPFVDLLKTSMQTFLNAMTYPDKTLYPVASTNEQDLLNLMDVYMDAVLNPRLLHAPQIFEQEGWHLEIDEGGLRYNGVVLNEMKGATSDPDDVVVQGLCEALFPSTCYRFESGGRPRAIPTLTYDAFVDAHARHYHMANARLFLYGDVRLEPELELLDRYCRQARGDSGPANPLEEQPPVVDLHMRKTMQSSPENAAVAVGYVLGSYSQRGSVLAAEVLTDALFGSNEAPFKSALLEAGLGEDVEAFVYGGVLQPFLVVELRGAREGSAERFVDLVDGLFSDAARDGLPRENIEASLASYAFSLRERDFGYADGVALAAEALSSWLYDTDDPVSYLRFEDDLRQLRSWLDDRGWERFVETTFVESRHRGACELVCVEDGPQTPAAQEAAELDALLQGMDDDARSAVAQRAQELRRLQEKPDDPADTARLPRLSPADAGEGRERPAFGPVAGTPRPCLYHHVPTNRIDYTFHYFDLTCLTWDELPWATLLCSVLGRLGTHRRSAAELDCAIEERLGRLTFSCAVQTDHHTHEATPRLVVAASAIEENVADLAALPAEVWGQTLFDDVARIRTILAQQKIDYEQSFVASGHGYALARAQGYTAHGPLLAQHLGNVDYYRFVCGLLEAWETVAPDVAARLADVRDRVFRSGGDLHSFAGCERDLDAYWNMAGDLGLAPRDEQEPRLVVPDPQMLREAFIVPSDVCFVAKAAGGTLTGATYGGPWTIATRAINLGYLWETVRVRGGAYGCGLKVNADGSMGFHTFRDPNLDSSVAAFDGAGDWLAAHAFSPEEFDGYTVGAIAAQDAPRKARRIVHRQGVDYLARVPKGWRAEIRVSTLDASANEVGALAPHLQAAAASEAVCVFGNREAIAASGLGLEPVDLLAGARG